MAPDAEFTLLRRRHFVPIEGEPGPQLSTSALP